MAKLYTPVAVGPLALSHRVVPAPLTRLRSEQPGDIPGDLMALHYGQRASAAVCRSPRRRPCPSPAAVDAAMAASSMIVGILGIQFLWPSKALRVDVHVDGRALPRVGEARRRRVNRPSAPRPVQRGWIAAKARGTGAKGGVGVGRWRGRHVGHEILPRRASRCALGNGEGFEDGPATISNLAGAICKVAL
jgi:hypothetical protein